MLSLCGETNKAIEIERQESTSKREIIRKCNKSLFWNFLWLAKFYHLLQITRQEKGKKDKPKKNIEKKEKKKNNNNKAIFQ